MSTNVAGLDYHKSNEECNPARKFWTEHSTDASEEEMALDSQARKLGEREIPEVLSYLPAVRGSKVLELGAGIGRYTSHLAQSAAHVIAVDFIQAFICKNRERNGHYGNTTFRQADVMELEYDDNSLDLVFSNWLLMYLSDHQVVLLLRRILAWLRPGCHLFFRESCFKQSGDMKRKSNPTKYRSPAHYMKLIEAASCECDAACYHILTCRPVQAYIELKDNRNQLCWVMEKVVLSTESVQRQSFLDSQQYSRANILKYERVFGEHFISPGGKKTTEEFVQQLGLEPGHHVLDVGSGIGGSAFFMTQKYDVRVTGIDLSTNMVCLALERANQLATSKVQFEISDAATRQYSPGTFDVIYSRDTILHIKDKRALFSSFLKWLKPGGRLLITDYCCSDEAHSPHFAEYIKQRGYHLLPVKQYSQILEEVGFVDVKAEDRTDQFVDILDKELDRTEAQKDTFIQDFSEDDYNDIVNGWRSKVQRCTAGDQRWGFFYARKPTVS